MYVVPETKPVWSNVPSAIVCTLAGIVPVPETRPKVMVTPDNPCPTLVLTVPPTLKISGGGGGAVIEK